MRMLKWFCIGLLALGCAVGLTACSDDEDDGAAADTAGGGDTIIIEGDDADDIPATPVVEDAAEGDTETDGDTNVTLVAPQLVSPLNWDLIGIEDETEGITFRWQAVPGAARYIFEVNGNRRAVGGTWIVVRLGAGTHYWRVSAQDAAGAIGPASRMRGLAIRQM